MQDIEQGSVENRWQSASATNPMENYNSVAPARPKVSAVIPAYNSEGFVADAIESILAQTIPVDEIIVVDDGSKDRTAEIASRFECTRVITQANAGQGAARNVGIREATGEWIAFLDADDLWMPEKMEIQLKCIAPDVGVIFSGRYTNVTFGGLWHRHCYIGPSGALVRKQTLVDVQGFEGSRAIKSVEDLNIWLKIAATNWRFVQTREGLWKWRSTGQNESANNYAMVKAELANLHQIAERVSCDPKQVEHLADSIRIEYGRNLIASKEWDHATEVLAGCIPGKAQRWLRLACSLKNSHLARVKLVRWLHGIDRKNRNYTCTGNCSLANPQRIECQQLCRKPNHPAP
jgi:glycosyltransferase involved in cell wall biosynthesis